MNRKDRKKEANKRLTGIVLAINQKFSNEFKRTNSMPEAVKLTESYIRHRMAMNPQEQHMWERAAREWDEGLSNELDKAIEEANR